MTVADFDSTITSVTQLIRERAEQYYPCLAGEQVEVRLVNTRCRQFAVLCELEISSAVWQRTLLAKIRRNSGYFPDGAERELVRSYVVARPDLKGAEHRALTRVAQHFDVQADPRFFSVPALDSLLDDQVFVLERVPAQSLSRMLRSCATPVVANATRRRLIESVGRTGTWLRRFHSMRRSDESRERGTTRTDFLNWIQSVGTFLAVQNRGRRFFASVENRITAGACQFLPEQLPCSTLHDDFAPRNVLIDQQDRVGVIDTLMEWYGCVWEDLAQFVVSMHLNKLRTLSCGVLFPERFLSELEESLISGYFGGESVPWPAIRLYQAQIAMTKWAAMVHDQNQQPNWRGASRLAISSRQLATYVEDRLRRMEQSTDGLTLGAGAELGSSGGSP